MLCFVILAVIFSSLSHFNLTESFRIAVTKVAQAECLPCSQIKFWWTVFAWWNTHLDCHNSCNYIIICSNLHFHFATNHIALTENKAFYQRTLFFDDSVYSPKRSKLYWLICVCVFFVLIKSWFISIELFK